MTRAVPALFALRHRRGPAAQHIVRQLHLHSVHFFQGVLIGLAILTVIWLGIG